MPFNHNTATQSRQPQQEAMEFVKLLHQIELERKFPNIIGEIGRYKKYVNPLKEAIQKSPEDFERVKTTVFNQETSLQSLYAIHKQDQDQAAEQETRRIRFRDDAYFENRPTREWLIDKIVSKRSVNILFGPPGCLKSFLVMAWAMSLGTGIEWLGHKKVRCPVAYIVAEGDEGVGSRINAWKKHNKHTGESGVKWYPESLTLQDASTLSELITALKEDFAETPGLLIIDTLHRCSGGADENSNNDMGKVINAADFIRKAINCSVVIIHHTGKNGELRGASCLSGDVEGLIKVMPTDTGCVVTCEKMKDAPAFPPLYLEKEVIPFGTTEEDSSLVLIAGNKPSKLIMSKSEQTMYALLMGKELTHSEWLKLGTEAKLSESTAKNAIRSLTNAGRVKHVGKDYSIVVEDSVEG